MGIGVYIELGGINTLTSPDSIVDLYATFNQAESQNKSDNIKFGLRQRMKSGKTMLNHSQFLGYTKGPDGVLQVVPEEAEIVQKIFDLYVQGNGVRKIKRYLEEHGIKTVTGKREWSTSTIDRMLSNEKYVGQVLMQKTYTPDFLTGKQVKNDGQLDMYLVEDSRGLEIPYDDIPLIQERYEKFKAGEDLSYDHLGFTITQDEILDSIYLPIYYNPEIRTQLDSLKNEYDLVTVGQLVEDGLISISTGDEVGKLAYGTGQIPFIRTSDIANWEIKLDPKQGLSEDIYAKLALKQDVRPYDILMVRDGTYLVGTCAMISPSETKIVYQSHLFKIRSNDHDRFNPYLLLSLLSSPIVKQQIRVKQFTQDIIDTLGRRIMELELPIPKDKATQEQIITHIKEVFDKRNEAKELMRNVLLNVTPLHRFDDDSSFMTLV